MGEPVSYKILPFFFLPVRCLYLSGRNMRSSELPNFLQQKFLPSGVFACTVRVLPGVSVCVCVCVCVPRCAPTYTVTQKDPAHPSTRTTNCFPFFHFSVFFFLKNKEPTPPRIPIEALGTPAPPRAPKTSAAPHLGSDAAGGRQSKCGSTRGGGGGVGGGGAYSRGGVEEDAGSRAVGVEVCTVYQRVCVCVCVCVCVYSN